MSIRIKKIAFYISFLLSILIVLAKCDRGIPTETAEYFSISGAVTMNKAPADSVEVNLTGDAESSTLTDSLGRYRFDDLAEGLYAVIPSYSGYDFTPSKLQTRLAGSDLDAQNFTMGVLNPELLLIDESLAFGEVSVSGSRLLKARVTNLGPGKLSLTKFTFSNPLFSTSLTGLEIAAKKLDSIPVTFSPKDSATVTAQLTITTNDPQKPTVVISLSGRGVVRKKPNLLIDQTKLDFGFVSLGESNTQNLVLGNNGGDTLKISSITSTKPVFTATPAKVDIPVGKSQIIKVTFTPQQAALSTATLNIANNSGNLPSATVSLSGTGGQYLPPRIGINPAELDFGQVFIDSQAVLNLEISSVGNDTLLLTSYELNNNSFSIDFSSTALAPGAKKTFPVYIKASTRGHYEGTLSIYTSDPSNTVVRIPLRAEVGTPPPSEMRLYPAQLAFGKVVAGFEDTRAFWVVNPTDVPLVVSKIRSSIPDDFKVSVESLLVNPHDSAQVRVTFSPKVQQQYSGWVVVRTNVTGSDSVNVTLSGEGGAAPQPAIELNPSSVDFSSVIVKSKGLANMTVKNKGPGVLVIMEMKVDNSAFWAETFTGVLTAGASRSLQLVFEPQATGVATGTLTIKNNDPNQPIAEVQLRGTGIDTSSLAPVMLLSTHKIDFGRVILQTTGNATFKINNIGKETLVVSRIISNNNVFQLDRDRLDVLPGAGESVKVTFTPTGEGTVQGLILVESDDQIVPLDSIRVSGQGVSASGIITEQEVYVPGGTFMMGQGSGETVRQVTLSNFYMDTYEVTNQEYKEFMDAGGYDNSAYWTSKGWQWRKTSREQNFDPDHPKPRYWGSGENPWESDPFSNTPDSPVVGLSWYEAYAYARFRDKSLPTEAQWEYVARSEAGRVYPWGNTYSGDLSNHGQLRSPYYDESDGFRYAAPVKSFPQGATPEGICSLAGNVMEWCLDWHAPYNASDIFNPGGPTSGDYKVLRGGSWLGAPEYSQNFHRNNGIPSIRNKDAGIRLVRNY